jgi:hypothetical protein
MRLPSQQRRLRRWLAVALVLVTVGVGGLVAIRLRQPMHAVVTPVADAYVSTAHPDANYGTEATLRADATPKIRSYLRFRLPESGHSGGAAPVVPDRRPGRLLGPSGEQQLG